MVHLFPILHDWFSLQKSHDVDETHATYGRTCQLRMDGTSISGHQNMQILEGDGVHDDAIAPSGRLMHIYSQSTSSVCCILYKSSTQPCGPLEVT